MQIGELARATGVTVRTLHHYDALGLLVPEQRTASGYRVYGPEQVQRLYRIIALRQLGFSLEEVGGLLEQVDPQQALQAHLVRLDRELAERQAMRERLTRVLDALEHPQTRDFVEAIEVLMSMERYYSPEERARLAELHRDTTPAHIEQTQHDWTELAAHVEALLEEKVDPSDPRAQAAVDRWDELVHRFTQGDPGIQAALGRMYAEQGPSQASRGVISEAICDFVARARALRM